MGNRPCPFGPASLSSFSAPPLSRCTIRCPGHIFGAFLDSSLSFQPMQTSIKHPSFSFPLVSSILTCTQTLQMPSCKKMPAISAQLGSALPSLDFYFIQSSVASRSFYISLVFEGKTMVASIWYLTLVK